MELKQEDEELQELALEIVRQVSLGDLEGDPASPKNLFVGLCENVRIRMGNLPVYPSRMKKLANELVKLFLEKLKEDGVRVIEELREDLPKTCDNPFTERLLKRALVWRRLRMPTEEDIKYLDGVAALG